jgi:predicted amidophosphoribosyltransferase
MPKSSLLDIIFPSRCAVCDLPGPNLCEACESVLIPRPHRFLRGHVQGFAATSYSKEVSKMLVAFKDQGQFGLAKELSLLMQPLIAELQSLSGKIYLVPAPSRDKNFSKRGFVPSVLLANELAIKSQRAVVLDCLSLDKSVRDQVGLTGGERIANLKGKMQVRGAVSGKSVYLVDDVVTTGATIQEAWRALTLAGALVMGALVVSEAKQDAGSVRKV